MSCSAACADLLVVSFCGVVRPLGRKEILMFFYLYAIIELLAIFLDSGIIPTANVSYPVSTLNLLNRLFLILCLVTSVVRCDLHRPSSGRIHMSSHQRFRWLPIRGGWNAPLTMGERYRHPRPLQLRLTLMQLLRLSTLVVFGVSFFVAIATFKKIAGFDYAKPIGLWIIYILWPLVCSVIYIVSQLILVFRTLEDRWPIGDIVFGTAFFTVAQVILFAFSVTICDAIKHYIDGLFFFTLCMLLSVMMVYKYWDSITVRRRVTTCVWLRVLIGVSSAKTSSSPLAPRRLSGKSRIRFSPAVPTMATKIPRATTRTAALPQVLWVV